MLRMIRKVDIPFNLCRNIFLALLLWIHIRTLTYLQSGDSVRLRRFSAFESKSCKRTVSC